MADDGWVFQLGSPIGDDSNASIIDVPVIVIEQTRTREDFDFLQELVELFSRDAVYPMTAEHLSPIT